MKAGRPVVIGRQPEEDALGELRRNAKASQCPVIEAAATVQMQSQVLPLASVNSNNPPKHQARAPASLL